MTLTYTNSSVHHFRRLFVLAYDATDYNEAGIKDKRKDFFQQV